MIFSAKTFYLTFLARFSSVFLIRHISNISAKLGLRELSPRSLRIESSRFAAEKMLSSCVVWPVMSFTHHHTLPEASRSVFSVSFAFPLSCEANLTVSACVGHYNSRTASKILL